MFTALLSLYYSILKSMFVVERGGIQLHQKQEYLVAGNVDRSSSKSRSSSSSSSNGTIDGRSDRSISICRTQLVVVAVVSRGGHSLR